MNSDLKFTVDKSDLNQLIRDIDKLNAPATQKKMMRKSLNKGAQAMNSEIKSQAKSAFRLSGSVAGMFKRHKKSYNGGYYIVLAANYKGNTKAPLIHLMDAGTKERRQKSTGQKTGRIEHGKAKTYSGFINTKFMQRAFDKKESEAYYKVIKSIDEELTRLIGSSRKMIIK